MDFGVDVEAGVSFDRGIGEDVGVTGTRVTVTCNGVGEGTRDSFVSCAGGAMSVEEHA